MHALLFALLSVTARVRFSPSPVVLAAVLGYAAVSEVVQATLLPERSGDLWDLLADAVGALLGWRATSRR